MPLSTIICLVIILIIGVLLGVSEHLRDIAIKENQRILKMYADREDKICELQTRAERIMRKYAAALSEKEKGA